ncbi:Sugar lactone lactonase YvrE [Tranquillimonas rosea]|uniref:Sugar lactone lactonase YvrE n=1 Tax=Tranquillimonas rosea TaxID=641238 RepID=A0A1H9QXE4_9RHOB|nr:SMP-30/gluconolactonase/LRE family protein [Tranquillimonas rosea]SER65154.1 Sugar lactone lactonase YvrE [Tranquillimonas rosea]
MIFDDRHCTLGEGPLWHPVREQLFWFDIMGKRLLSREGDTPLVWEFDEHVSAAGWVDRDTLLIASDRRLLTLDLKGDTCTTVCPLEADNPATRSNDGRADPWGGFWIGTMGLNAEPGAGAIYRYHKGELRTLVAPISIPNAICFTPDAGHAHFADTPTGTIWRVAMDKDGWFAGEPEPWVDLTDWDGRPDGAVIDAEGVFWNAQFGAGRVAAYDARGQFVRSVTLTGSQTTCPAFGGPDLSTLFCTSAQEGLDAAQINSNADHGRTFAIEDVATGRPEPQIRL